ncbi:MAG: zf-HC2 domain-containing protein [Anaerolineaceae bacterium]|nr:zf-HC2 domain-containing protein [Anaerolineaceae bacterium]
MIEHVTDLLGAYLDGELGGSRLRQVEDHLIICAACRLELDELRSLSGLLHETLPIRAFTPTERFAANLTLRLPRRPEAAQARRPHEEIWWIIPASAVGLWFILQIVDTASTLLSAAGATGLLGSAAALLQSGPQQNLWLSASMSLFGNDLGGSGRALLTGLNNISTYWIRFTTPLVWRAGIGLLFVGWLAVWLTHRRPNAQPRLPQASSHS